MNKSEREGLSYGWMKIGTPVNFHSIIDEGPTLATKIKHEPFLAASGDWVCFVEGKAGYVLCEAVTWRDLSGGETVSLLVRVDSEAYRRGQLWAVELLEAWEQENGEPSYALPYAAVAEELREALDRLEAEGLTNQTI